MKIKASYELSLSQEEAILLRYLLNNTTRDRTRALGLSENDHRTLMQMHDAFMSIVPDIGVLEKIGPNRSEE